MWHKLLLVCLSAAIFKLGVLMYISNTFSFLVLNHSRVALTVCLGSFSCWKENLCPSHKSVVTWDKVWFYTSLSSQHDSTTSVLYCRDDVLRVRSSVRYNTHLLLCIYSLIYQGSNFEMILFPILVVFC